MFWRGFTTVLEAQTSGFLAVRQSEWRGIDGRSCLFYNWTFVSLFAPPDKLSAAVRSSEPDLCYLPCSTLMLMHAESMILYGKVKKFAKQRPRFTGDEIPLKVR